MVDLHRLLRNLSTTADSYPPLKGLVPQKAQGIVHFVDLDFSDVF